jgi:hypothetical protein
MQITPDTGRERKATGAQKSMPCDATPPAAFHVPLCHVAFPFPLCDAVLSLLTDLHGCKHARTLRSGVRHTATWRALSCIYHPHTPTRLPPPSPVSSALQNIEKPLVLLSHRSSHKFPRIQNLWPPGPFRCPVCVCAVLNVFICMLVDLFCPPPTASATVLPLPHSLCSLSSYLLKMASS